MNFSIRPVAMAAALLSLFADQPVHAQQASNALERTPGTAGTPVTVAIEDRNPLEVRIVGSREQPPVTRVTEDIEAAPASVTTFGKRDLDSKTLTTYGDVYRGVTGMHVTEYGQGLVAYGVTMRGFDEGHGRNIATYLDGMPLNVTGSQHTNGYADVSQLIPELVNRVEIVRGPFSVYAGNHAVAGSVQYYTDATPVSSIKATVDNFGRSRIVPIYSTAAGPGRFLAALDATQGSGYTDQSDQRRLNFFTRYTMPLGNGLAAFRLQLYDATADAPGYLDRDLLKSGQIGLRSALSKGIGDAKSQQNLVFNFRSNDIEGTSGWDSGWFVSAYGNSDLRKRWTNFDLTTPAGSSVPLGQERDHLNQIGFDVRKNTAFKTAGMPSQVVAGAQFNNESISARQFQTDGNRNPLSVTAANPDVVGVDRRVKTMTQSLYGQYQIAPIERLKLTLGLRYDRLSFDTRLNPDDDTYAAAVAAGTSTAVSTSTSQFSPKLGAGVTVVETGRDRVEIYGNVARGLKSPYAFSDFYGNLGVSTVIPALTASSLRSTELGVQGGAKDGGYKWRAALWSTQQDKEVDRNSAGLLQNFKKTDRNGLDLEASTAIGKATRVFANYSRVSARINDPLTAGADRIPNVPEYVATIGVSSVLNVAGRTLDLSLMDSLIGPQAITADNSLRTHSFHRYVARAAYNLPEWKGTTVFLNLTGYSRQLDEVAIDFGGGQVGTSPKPRLRATLGLQIAL